jgi:type I restriction enzyme S subunit
MIRTTNVRNGFIDTENVRYVTEEIYQRWTRRLVPKRDDIILTREAPLGDVGKIRTNESIFLGQRLYHFRPNIKKLNADFLLYSLLSEDLQGQIRGFGSGSTVEHMRLEDIPNLEINLPPLPIQRRISGILSAYDDLIENNQRRIRILETMARALYREWFVHFRFPGHENVPLVPSPLGAIPEGWEVVAFTDTADVLSGGTPKTDVAEYWNGEIPFFTPRDVPDCFYIQNTDKHVTELGLAKCASALYSPDTVFITARGTVGKVVLPAVPMAMNQSCYALRGKTGVPQRYLFLLTLHQVEYLKTNTGGATFDTIVVDTFRRMQVLKPQREIIARFADQVNAMFEQVNSLQRQTQNLRRTRDLLLPRLLSGEVELMRNDLRLVSHSFMKLHQDMERISRSLRPTYLDLFAQIDQALQPVQKYNQEIARMSSLTNQISAPFAEIMKATRHWQSMCDKITVSSRVISDLGKLHSTWARGLKPMQDQAAHVQAVMKLSLGSMAFRVNAAERILSGVDFKAIHRALALPESGILTLRDSITAMTATYGRLSESIRSHIDITQLPVFALPGATRELFVASHTVGMLRIEDDLDEDYDVVEAQLVTEVETETADCISLLETLDPEFVAPYFGAREALRGNNPDRARHILSSLRELCNHVLRRIAPDDLVLAWVPGNQKDLIDKGRPTRRARFLYVYRELNHAPLTDFIEQDTRAFVKFVETLNRIHELRPSLTDAQLRALLLRTESWLTYILQLWKGMR